MPPLQNLFLRARRGRAGAGLAAASLLVATAALGGAAHAQSSAPARHCLPVTSAAPGKSQGAPCLFARITPVDGVSGNGRVLVVFLPDSAASADSVTSTAAELARQLGAPTIAIEPTGDRRDHDNTAQVAALAGALSQLRVAHPAQKILLVGHAGGAALAALLAARFPASADAYLLAACPCGQSVLAESRQMPPATRIAMVVGSRDDLTPTGVGEAYAAALQARGVTTRLTYAVAATHVSVQRAPAFFMLAQGLADGLLAPARGARP